MKTIRSNTGAPASSFKLRIFSERSWIMMMLALRPYSIDMPSAMFSK